MKLKVIYIAGPFRGATPWAVEQNVRRAEGLALEVWRLPGFAASCPHTNTRYFDGAAPDQAFLDGTLEMLRRCDGVLLTENWKDSKGACSEVREAVRQGIPVFWSIECMKRYYDHRVQTGLAYLWGTEPYRYVKHEASAEESADTGLSFSEATAQALTIINSMSIYRPDLASQFRLAIRQATFEFFQGESNKGKQKLTEHANQILRALRALPPSWRCK